VFGKYSKVTLNTPSNQENYHMLGKVINSPPLGAESNISIIRTFI